MPKFSTNNLLDKEEKKSRYAGLQVDQPEERSRKENSNARSERRKVKKTAQLPDQVIGAFPEHKERK